MVAMECGGFGMFKLNILDFTERIPLSVTVT
jgi:hypothetical protein